jgi:protein TonB
VTGKENAAPPPEAPALFGTLLASRPERNLLEAARTGVGSVLVHALIIAGLVWATMSIGQEIVAEEQVTLIELPPEEAPPPPPPPPPSPTVAPEPAVEIAKGFQTLTVPDVVPPDIPPPSIGMTIREEDFSGLGREGGKADGSTSPEAKTVDDLAVAPTFTPMTVRPELKNADEVGRALQRNYPPLLRDAGIGGQAVLWFFIDEQGTVVKTQVKATSGYSALDEAAAKVAVIMRFRPAMNRDKAVPVWVEIPIKFAVN